LGIPARISTAVLVFVALTAAGGASAVPARGSTAPCASAGARTEGHALLCLVNRARAEHGLPELRESTRLDRSSRLRALAIRRCAQFSHTPCGQSFRLVFVRAGYHGRSTGENLGWGGGRLGSPARTLAAWCSSPPHRRNLLGRRWRQVGVALVHAQHLFGARDVTVWVLQLGGP